jgi:hypothetical protein
MIFRRRVYSRGAAGVKERGWINAGAAARPTASENEEVVFLGGGYYKYVAPMELPDGGA